MSKKKKEDHNSCADYGEWKDMDVFDIFPQDWRHKKGLLFHWTSWDNPEQIDIIYGKETVGYVRIRRGRLTAEYTDEKRKDVEFLRHHFTCQDEGEKFFFGAFAGQWHRAHWLEKIADAFDVKPLKKGRSKPDK